MGSAAITDAIASSFGIRRSQAERLKCVAGSAIASPADHRELIPVNGPGEGGEGAVPVGPLARGADDKNRIVRAELVAVVTQELAVLTGEIGKALKTMGFAGSRAGQVVLTGGGAELAGMADFMQGALGQQSHQPGPKSVLGRSFPEGPKPTTRPVLRHWRACVCMPPKTRSISARWARDGAGFTAP